MALHVGGTAAWMEARPPDLHRRWNGGEQLRERVLRAGPHPEGRCVGGIALDWPDFQDFQDFVDVNKDRLFAQLSRMDLVQAHWPMTHDEFTVLVQSIQDNAVHYAQCYSQMLLYAYHEWLRGQFGL